MTNIIPNRDMKVLLFGESGMLGSAFSEVFQNELIQFRKTDITSESKLESLFFKKKPDVVINSAAYTNVDGCETNKDLAFSVNGTSLNFLSRLCNEINATLIHISTDYVFQGLKEKGYDEFDKTNPINVYGLSKELGEKYILENSKKYYLIRTSWLFGPNGKNFVDNIIRKCNSDEEIFVVNDQFGSPTYTYDLAKYISKLVKSNYAFGKYHITNKGVCTWYQFANEIKNIKLLKCKITPVSSLVYSRSAQRPKYSVLLNTKIDFPYRDWQSSLLEYLNNY